MKPAHQCFPHLTFKSHSIRTARRPVRATVHAGNRSRSERITATQRLGSNIISSKQRLGQLQPGSLAAVGVTQPLQQPSSNNSSSSSGKVKKSTTTRAAAASTSGDAAAAANDMSQQQGLPVDEQLTTSCEAGVAATANGGPTQAEDGSVVAPQTESVVKTGTTGVVVETLGCDTQLPAAAAGGTPAEATEAAAAAACVQAAPQTGTAVVPGITGASMEGLALDPERPAPAADAPTAAAAGAATASSVQAAPAAPKRLVLKALAADAEPALRPLLDQPCTGVLAVIPKPCGKSNPDKPQHQHQQPLLQGIVGHGDVHDLW